MTSEKPLSQKKTTQQTISISPALKDRIEQYVIEKQNKDPKDHRVKSISAFYNFVLEKTIDCFEQGKTLNDFETFVDSEIRGFFEKISFNALIPYYETAIRTNRYTHPFFEKNIFFYLTLRRLYLDRMDPYDIASIKSIFNRVKNYLMSQNLTKDVNLDIFIGKNGKGLTGIFEYSGLYKNLTFENCKYNAALFGLLGTKITNFLYSDKENYFRFDLKATDLFYRKELAKKERIELVNHNLSYFFNYPRILDDKDYYFWMRLAEDRNAIINFNNEETQKDWINLTERDIDKFGDHEDYALNLLKFFEKLHWIEIESEKDLIFQIKLSEKRFQNEKELLLGTLSQRSKILQINGKYQLKRIIE
ncbi:MAG: hypothetical protein JSV62_11935 [Promethearchaeota archaeon]|nr:MAG: hypothetical protein JSV62_11935 [Candidatus Lokiarchaeota archaeon]